MSTTASPAVRTSSGTNGFAVAGLVVAIVGIFLFDIILGPLGIIFGAIGWSRANRGESGKGMSIAAVVLGIVDVLLFIVLVALIATNGHHHFSWHI